MFIQSIQGGFALQRLGTVKVRGPLASGVPLGCPWPRFWVPARGCTVVTACTHRWHRARGAGGWWAGGVSGLFPSSLHSCVPSGGALLCLSLVKPLPKARSSNVWLCHTSQKESGRGKRRRQWLGFGVWVVSELPTGLSQPRRAAGGRGSPSGRSESAAPACCSRSSSAQQTSSYPRAFWRRTCCNGSLRSFQGTGTPPPVTAERRESPGYRQ